MEAPAQEYYYRSVVATEKRLSMDLKQEPFVVEEFLDFSNDEENVNIMTDVKSPLSLAFNKDCYNAGSGGGGLNSAESSSVTAVDSCNSSDRHVSVADGSFTAELCVPYDDIAELEWLSTITEESFSSEDMQKLQLISGMTARLDGSRVETNMSDLSLHSKMPVPGKARSKRSRTAPGKWASGLLVLSPTSSSSEADHPFPTTGGKSLKAVMKKKEGLESGPGDGRRCLHCATDKTPQWRTGPMGPKSLCNACGVRYKSGRLVPEYRPAASPTFVQTKHSNSHRKVLELRRQKEMHRPHHLHSHRYHHDHQFLQHHPNMIFDVPNGEDYLMHQNIGPDFRQLL